LKDQDEIQDSGNSTMASPMAILSPVWWRTMTSISTSAILQ
jgi:hypothetical protein